MSDKKEIDLKEYLEAKFAEQTKLHTSHPATTAARVKSIEIKVDAVDQRVTDLQWFIGILVTIIIVAMACVAFLRFNHVHTQEVTSRMSAQVTNCTPNPTESSRE